MKGVDPIVCLNAADAWHSRKGINHALSDFNSEQMNELGVIDARLYDELIELIKTECNKKRNN